MVEESKVNSRLHT